MNRVKFLCIKTYGDWIFPDEKIEVIFGLNNNIYRVFVKGIAYQFHSNQEEFYQYFINMAEHRDKKIESILYEK